jgi:acyl carrier protein
MQDRPTETDGEFLALCDLPPQPPRALQVATAVRRTIALFADVNPETIHAGDRIPEDLGDIFYRESPIVVEFLMLLEEELEIRIPDSAADMLCRETVTVKEIVSEIHRLVSGRL